MPSRYEIPFLPIPFDLETKPVLKQLAKSHQKLAELKGIAQTIPNEKILINTLMLQEARDSSSVENIITTQDDIYKADLEFNDAVLPAAVKEVRNYREALWLGYELVKKYGLLTNNHLISIQNVLKNTDSGFRSIPGTTLKGDNGAIIYEPPQDHAMIVELMDNLENFINTDDMSDLDPLVKMTIIHHQFESIHPFLDGNGRTGRILNVLYLVLHDLLDYPILYLSRYITRNKGEYYSLIQAVRDVKGDNRKEWEAWIIFMLRGIEETSEETIALVKSISNLMSNYKNVLRPLFGKKYKHELLNNLFFHPYTKIEFMQKDMMVNRDTAAKYLDDIVKEGLLEKQRIGRDNYYINTALMNLFLEREWLNNGRYA